MARLEDLYQDLKTKVLTTVVNKNELKIVLIVLKAVKGNWPRVQLG